MDMIIRNNTVLIKYKKELYTYNSSLNLFKNLYEVVAFYEDFAKKKKIFIRKVDLYIDFNDGVHSVKRLDKVFPYSLDYLWKVNKPVILYSHYKSYETDYILFNISHSVYSILTISYNTGFICHLTDNFQDYFMVDAVRSCKQFILDYFKKVNEYCLFFEYSDNSLYLYVFNKNHILLVNYYHFIDTFISNELSLFLSHEINISEYEIYFEDSIPTFLVNFLNKFICDYKVISFENHILKSFYKL